MVQGCLTAKETCGKSEDCRAYHDTGTLKALMISLHDHVCACMGLFPALIASALKFESTDQVEFSSEHDQQPPPQSGSEWLGEIYV